MSMKGIMERFRQRVGVGERTFKPTPNVRIPAMLQEADDFSVQLYTFKTLLVKYDKALGGFLESLPLFCRANLPRVWEAVEGTAMCEPTPTEITSRFPHRVGGDYDEVVMSDAREIQARRVEALVRPIDRWHDSLAVVKTRLKKLESLRMEVDARRRRIHGRYQRALARMNPTQAAALGAQIDSRRQRALAERTVVEEGEGSEAGEFGAHSEMHDLDAARDAEDSAREAVRRHRQLEALSESYQEAEQLVFEQLSGLVRDAAFFKSYVVSAMIVVKETMQASLVALGHCMRPLPGFSTEEPEGETRYGHVADITDLITGMPMVIRAGGRVLPPGSRVPGGPGVALDAIRPKRMTAQPLQVAADETVAGGETVPAVTRGASAVPADRVAALQAAEDMEGHLGGGYGVTGRTPAAAEPYGGFSPTHTTPTTYTHGTKAFPAKAPAFAAMAEEVATT